MRLEVFPAADGDSLLLTWGSPAQHMLIDGGRKGVYRTLRPRLAEISEAGGELNLFVLTHIDADHIEGALALADDATPPITVREVWYNGFDQMSHIEALGPRQGDDFSEALRRLQWPWNAAVQGRALQVETAPRPLMRGDLQLMLLSPDGEKLRDMRREWERWRTKEAARQAAAEAAEAAAQARRGVPDHLEVLGAEAPPCVLDVALLSASTPTDLEAPNGSSIAFLAEHHGRRALFTGDAHPDLLLRSLRPLAEAEGGRLRIDLLKVSHHGSAGNTTAEVLALLDCRRFLLSTSGARHGHPDPEAVARILVSAPDADKVLYFNYRSPWSEAWDRPELQQAHNYACVYGDDGRLDLEV